MARKAIKTFNKKFRSHFFALMSFFMACNYAFSQIDYKLDSLNSVINSIPDKQIRIDKIFEILDKNLDVAISLALGERVYALADSVNNQKAQAMALERIGMAYNSYGDHLKASEKLNDAMAMYQSLQDQDGVHKVKRSLGETYRAARNYDVAMDYLNQSLEYFLVKKDSVMLSRIYNRMGAVLFEEIFLEREGLGVKKEFQTPHAETHLIFEKDPQWKLLRDSLINFMDLAKEMALKKERFDLVISTEILHAAFFTYSGQFDQSVEKFEEILNVIELYDLKEDLPLVLYNLSRLHLPEHLNQPEIAEMYAKQAIEESKKMNIKAYEYMGNNILHQAQAAQGNFELAYKSLLEVIENLKVFTSDELEIKLRTQEFEYQLGQNEVDLRNRRNQLWIVWISTFLIILSFSFFIYLLNRRNKKNKLLLQELNQKNEMILKQNQELEQINAEKDKFFSIIAHDLRGPYANVIGISKILNEEVKKKNYAEIEKIATLIEKSSQKALELLSNLMQWSLSQTKRLNLNPEIIQLNDLVSQNLELFREMAQQKEINLNSDMVEVIQVFADREMLNTVFRNLISNALKFTRTDGRILISATARNGDVIVMVKDTGIGIDSKTLKEIFQLDRKTGRPGTAGEPSSGLGLILCKEFVELMGGKIWLESQVEKGTIIYFTIPSSPLRI